MKHVWFALMLVACGGRIEETDIPDAPEDSTPVDNPIHLEPLLDASSNPPVLDICRIELKACKGDVDCLVKWEEKCKINLSDR